jgi:hypothetical protein
MDANQVGFAHELSWEDIQEILDNKEVEEKVPV